MNENQIKELWKNSNAKFEQSRIITRQNTADITKLKVQSLLSSMKPIKIVTVLTGILWVGLGGVIIVRLFAHAFEKVSPFFLLSAALQILITAIALVIYICQIILIYQADISDTVIETQRKLTHLKSSSIWLARLLFLQLPLWTTFYWNKGMRQNGNIGLWIIQIAVTLSFTLIAVWLFFNIKYENKDKKWFKFIFSGKEWQPVLKAMELNKEIMDFEQER
jgi:hypothetical protein